MILPVISRELRLASRNRGTYVRRTVVACSAMVAVMPLVWLFRLPTGGTGETVFNVLAWACFVLCLVEGAFATTDCVAREKREGTLGLLFLTQLRPRDVLFGKLAVATVRSFTMLVAVLPLFAVPILFGGITFAECLRVGGTLVITLLYAALAGLFLSILCTTGLAALIGTMLLLIASLLGPVIVQWWMSALTPTAPASFWTAGPLGMLWHGRGQAFARDPNSFWLATGTSLVLCLVLLAAAMWVFTGSRRWFLEEQQRDTWWNRFLRPQASSGEGWSNSPSNDNPAVWLAERTFPGRKLLWVLIGIGIVICFLTGVYFPAASAPVMISVQLGFGLIIQIWIAATAPQSFNSSRQSGALELLLCTPLSTRDLVEGQLEALRNYFITPGLLIAMGLMAATVGGGIVGKNEQALSVSVMSIPFGMFWFLLFLLNLHALAYAGLWFGLTEARATRAAAKSAFLVLGLPFLTVWIPVLGLFGFFVWPACWLSWASRRVQRDLRLAAAGVLERRRPAR